MKNENKAKFEAAQAAHNAAIWDLNAGKITQREFVKIEMDYRDATRLYIADVFNG